MGNASVIDDVFLTPSSNQINEIYHSRCVGGGCKVAEKRKRSKEESKSTLDTK